MALSEVGLGALGLALLGQAFLLAIPYVLAALGGALSQQAGVVNMALEGELLVGGFVAALGAYVSGSAWLGLAAALAAGAVLGLLHAAVVVGGRANAIIAGIGLNLLALGGTRFFLKLIFNSTGSSARVAGLPLWWDGVLGASLGQPLLLGTVVAALAVQGLLFGTVFGLRLRAVGQQPQAAISTGVQPGRYRVAALVVAGGLAALGGAFLAFDQHQFTDGLSGGRGYIALAAVVLGRQLPLRAAAAALLFSSAEAVQIALQTLGVALPAQLLQVLPYGLALVAAALCSAGAARGAGPEGFRARLWGRWWRRLRRWRAARAAEPQW